MTETIEYLRRCADRKLLEASLTPDQCRELVQMHADLQIEREAVRVLRDAKIKQIVLRQRAERERARKSAHCVRAAAASLARRRPMYDGASGESAEEELAQAIEDIPLHDAGVTNWRAEAERLRAELARTEEIRADAVHSALLQADMIEQLKADVRLLQTALADLRRQVQDFVTTYGEADFYTGPALAVLAKTDPLQYRWPYSSPTQDEVIAGLLAKEAAR